MDGIARAEPSFEDLLGEPVFEMALNRPLERTGAVRRVVACVGQEVFRIVADHEAELAIEEPCRKARELDVDDGAHLLPVEPTIDNFTTLFESGSTPTWLWNSIIVTVATTVLTLILSSMAGYAFARIPFRGKKIAFPLVLAGLMVPKEAMFIPLFLIFADFDQHNTYHALVLPRIAAPLGVFIMTQFFTAIPPELEEAAVIDGASSASPAATTRMAEISCSSGLRMTCSSSSSIWLASSSSAG